MKEEGKEGGMKAGERREREREAAHPRSFL